MTNLNKGRFKCADEAHAVWNAFNRIYPWLTVKRFISDYHSVEYYFSTLADNLYKARLIHGSIYDEHGRIEDKDVAHSIVDYAAKHYFGGCLVSNEHLSIYLDTAAWHFIRDGEIRGTIFY